MPSLSKKTVHLNSLTSEENRILNHVRVRLSKELNVVLSHYDVVCLLMDYFLLYPQT